MLFQEPRTYPVIPQTVRNFLREVDGVVLPRFIKEDQVTILRDIQAVRIGRDKIIPYYTCVGSPWVDAVYDAWIEIGKIDSPQIGELATTKILSQTWWKV